ncbi:MAG: hypothetical protein AB1758_35290, partial [Candidatus Eremiobacterota bacterium]
EGFFIRAGYPGPMYDPVAMAARARSRARDSWFTWTALRKAEQGMLELRDAAHLSGDESTETAARLALAAAGAATSEKGTGPGRLHLFLYTFSEIERGAAASLNPGALACSLFGCLRYGNTHNLSESGQVGVSRTLLETMDPQGYLTRLGSVAGDPGPLLDRARWIRQAPWEAGPEWTAEVGVATARAELQAGRTEAAARIAPIALEATRMAAEGDPEALWHLERLDRREPPSPWLTLATLDGIARNLPAHPDSDAAVAQTLATLCGTELEVEADPARIPVLAALGRSRRILEVARRSEAAGQEANRYRLRRELGEAVRDLGAAGQDVIRETWQGLTALDPDRSPEGRLLDGLNWMEFLDVETCRALGRIVIAELEQHYEGKTAGEFVARTRQDLERAGSFAEEWRLWREFREVFSSGDVSRVQALVDGLKSASSGVREGTRTVSLGGVVVRKKRG